jgi:mannose-6-phosphate isomerase-like protein (cupin superfamily)
MADDVTVKRIDEIPPYSGPNALAGIEFKPAGRALGVTAWGMNVLVLAPGTTTYFEHDHAKSGQEEVYAVLDGDATLRAGGQDRHVARGALVRVGPGVTRKWLPGVEGVTLLAIGGTPGRAYEPEPR